MAGCYCDDQSAVAACRAVLLRAFIVNSQSLVGPLITPTAEAGAGLCSMHAISYPLPCLLIFQYEATLFSHVFSDQ